MTKGTGVRLDKSGFGLTVKLVSASVIKSIWLMSLKPDSDLVSDFRFGKT